MFSKHIFLTGFMGAGKSRVGRHLAQLLALPFVDTDREIEKEAGKTVRQIFEEEGETVFRQLEKTIIARLCAESHPKVIALGGGALNDSQTFARVHQNGLVIYLKSSPKAILKRVGHSRKRPLLDVQGVPNKEKILEQRIQDLLQKREPIYRQAHIVFDRDGLEAESVAEKLKQLIEPYLERKDGNH